MQVCDLVVNKPLKQFIREHYDMWRVAQEVNNNNENGSIERIMPKRDDMIRFIERSVKKFNGKYQTEGLIRKCFESTGQNVNDVVNGGVESVWEAQCKKLGEMSGVYANQHVDLVQEALRFLNGENFVDDEDEMDVEYLESNN